MNVAHSALPVNKLLTEFSNQDDSLSNVMIEGDDQSSLHLRNQRNKSMENVLSLAQFQESRQNQSQLLVRDDGSNASQERMLRNQIITRTPNFYKRNLDEAEKMASLERMRNHSFERITIDLPQIVNIKNYGPITQNNKKQIKRKSGLGDGSSFDFLDATTGASNGRNQPNIHTTDVSQDKAIKIGDYSTTLSRSEAIASAS